MKKEEWIAEMCQGTNGNERKRQEISEEKRPSALQDRLRPFQWSSALKKYTKKKLPEQMYSANISLDNSLRGGLLIYSKPDRIRVVFLSLDALSARTHATILFLQRKWHL